ncbi:hypothetical protein MTR67_052249 [Solanum verrucosum]|uniref:Uncharacterized protein n=1 Tax=Solanum verrucosum TaxID=315347 RepID=A0AAF1A3D4_SOLVR|nr:hypothetical protein MTR67_052249 [Solanum verrucosum]
MGSVAHIEDEKKELVWEVHRLARLGVQVQAHLDTTLMELKELVLDKSVEAFSQGGDVVFRYQERLCVPDVDYLRERILEEAHGSLYSIYPRATKMYRDL